MADTSELPLEALMTFLEVARHGRFTAAARVAGVNHSTVSRRISALEQAMGGRVIVRGSGGWHLTALGERAVATAERIEAAAQELRAGAGDVGGLVRIAAPDAFTAHFLAPAVTALRQRRPGLAVELIAATQRARQHRSGVDLEIVVGRPEVLRAYAAPLCAYSLRLYASTDYLRTHPALQTVSDLARHPLIYYVESSLQVDELDRALRELPASPPSVRSTSVFTHIEATAAGAGVGILPDFVADRDARLQRVLEREWSHPLAYWVVARDEGARNAVVAETLEAISDVIRDAGAHVPA